jgi:hypothetical protein
MNLIEPFDRNPATFLHAYTCLPLAQATRQAASAVLQDIADSGVLFALLMCEHKVSPISCQDSGGILSLFDFFVVVYCNLAYLL